MASNTVRIRIQPATLETLGIIASIRNKSETPGQIADIATDLLLDKVKEELEHKLAVNADTILKEIKETIDVNKM